MDEENKTLASILEGIQSLQRAREDESEPEDLMRGRTFIPRMSSASKKLLIQALKKRREANAPKRAARADKKAERKEGRLDKRTERREAREQMREANQLLRGLREKNKAEKREKRLQDKGYQDRGVRRRNRKIERYEKRKEISDKNLAAEAERKAAYKKLAQEAAALKKKT